VRLGIASLLAGLALYVGAAAARLSGYHDEAQPAWLTSLWFVATGLVVVGLLVLSNVAIRVYRGRT
jgi:hypothetical protein